MRPLRERNFISINDGELIIERALSDLFVSINAAEQHRWRVRGRRSNRPKDLAPIAAAVCREPWNDFA